MRAALLVAAVLLTGLAPDADAQSRTIRFSGEVSRGQTYSREIHPRLEFLLRPSPVEPDGWAGWWIGVAPKTNRAAGCDDLVWVATPPYRSNNPRYLDISYGTTARQALAHSPREFSFVLNCADYRTEERWVARLLWPYSSTGKELTEAREKLGACPLGKGRLWIRDSRIVSPTAADPERIGWIRFDVEIDLPQ
jgi:hypothetical protein